MHKLDLISEHFTHVYFLKFIIFPTLSSNLVEFAGKKIFSYFLDYCKKIIDCAPGVRKIDPCHTHFQDFTYFLISFSVHLLACLALVSPFVGDMDP